MKYFQNHRHATWLELFFDLMFVVALGKVTHLLFHVHDGHLGADVWWTFFLSFVPFWWIWVGHTVYANRFDTDSRRQRMITLVLMFLLVLMSVSIQEHVNIFLFVIPYCLARFLIAVMYFFSAKNSPKYSELCVQVGKIYIWGAMISGCAIFFSLPIAAIVFYTGIAFDIIVGRNLIRSKNDFPIHKAHFVERIGLLAIILLGESMISLSRGLSSLEWDGLTITTALCGFVIICMIWWIYFDSFALLEESNRDPNGHAIVYSQLLTYMGFGLLASSIGHAITGGLNIQDFRVMAILGMFLLYAGKQTAYFVNVPEYKKYIVINTAVVLAISGASLLLPRAEYILMGMTFSFAVYIALNYRAQMILYGKVRM